MLDASVAFLWPCRDGGLAMITPQNDEFAAMCRVLGQPWLATDPCFVSIPTRRQHNSALRDLLDPVVAQRALNELVAELSAASVPAG